MPSKAVKNQPVKTSQLSRWWTVVGVLAVLVCVAELSYWIAIRHKSEQQPKTTQSLASPQAKVLRTTQLTTDGLAKSNLVGGESELFFNEIGSEGVRLMELSGTGAPQLTAVSDSVQNAKVLDLSSSRQLLVSTGAALKDPPKTLFPKTAPLWVVSPGNKPQFLRKLSGYAGAWAPGGKIAYSRGKDLYLAEADGSNPKKLLTAMGPILFLRYSPDGSIIRMTLGIEGFRYAIWQVKSDGSDMRPILPLPGRPRASQVCCGTWSADGRYYFYEDLGEIWVSKETGGALTSLTQLTSGKQQFHTPVPGKDGRKVFVIGERAPTDSEAESTTPAGAKTQPADIYVIDLQLP